MTEELGEVRASHRWECLTVKGEALRDLVPPTTSVWPAHTQSRRRGLHCELGIKAPKAV